MSRAQETAQASCAAGTLLPRIICQLSNGEGKHQSGMSGDLREWGLGSLPYSGVMSMLR